jgi:hypothetical protein
MFPLQRGRRDKSSTYDACSATFPYVQHCANRPELTRAAITLGQRHLSPHFTPAHYTATYTTDERLSFAVDQFTGPGQNPRL